MGQRLTSFAQVRRLSRRGLRLIRPTSRDLNVLLKRMLDVLNDDPRLRAIALDALTDVVEALRLLDRADATIAKAL